MGYVTFLDPPKETAAPALKALADHGVAVKVVTGDNEHVTLDPGLYRVDVSPRGELLLASEEGRTVAVRTAVGYHGLELREPIAVHLKGGKEEESQLALLLPGGVALQAVGSHGRLRKDAKPQSIMSHPGFPDEAFKWLSPAVPFQRWLEPWTLKWGAIEPGTSPAPFAPQTFPPNWISTRVVTCVAPPAGSAGPAGPGTATGVPPIPPGSVVQRGPFPGYLVSTTPVTVTASVHVAGKAVELYVVSHVASLGIPVILSMTWLDVYRIVPTADGPVTFPGVIVATGRVPTSPPPPGTTWEAQVQSRLSSSTGQGVPSTFELRVDGVPIAQRTCGYYASYPGGPGPALKCQ
jgi:hypothetical protein